MPGIGPWQQLTRPGLQLATRSIMEESLQNRQDIPLIRDLSNA